MKPCYESKKSYLVFLMGMLIFTSVAADYDGDRLADPAVKSTIGNEWIVMFSTGNYTPVPLTILFE